MKTLHVKELKSGKRHVLVELDAGEKLVAVHEDRFYKTGYPQEMVVSGHILTESVRVSWCSLGQEWVS